MTKWSFPNKKQNLVLWSGYFLIPIYLYIFWINTIWYRNDRPRSCRFCEITLRIYDKPYTLYICNYTHIMQVNAAERTEFKSVLLLVCVKRLYTSAFQRWLKNYNHFQCQTSYITKNLFSISLMHMEVTKLRSQRATNTSKKRSRTFGMCAYMGELFRLPFKAPKVAFSLHWESKYFHIYISSCSSHSSVGICILFP